MMNSRLFLVAAFALLIGCSSRPQFKHDYVTGTDFSSYHTYALLQRHDMNPRWGPTVQDRVRSAVELSLQDKGFSPVAADEADILVAVHGALDPHVSVVEFGYEFPLRPWHRGGYYGPGWVGAFGSRDVVVLNVGRLTVDIIDRRSQRLVWRGTAFKEGVPDEPDAERIGWAVARVLESFPPVMAGRY
jgi:hypothetical protein